MSQLDYQSDSLKLGIKRLKLLAKYSEPLMQSYFGGDIDELAIGEQGLNLLQEADIIWYPDSQSGLKLSEPVRALMTHLLKDEKRRKINTTVGDFHENIRRYVQQINQAQQKNAFAESQYLQQQLTQEVDDLNSRIATGIKSLWYRLNSGFAFVDNLADKIHQNEKASQEVSRWLNGLEQINFDELIQLAGANAALRTILVRQLQSQVSEHFGSLREVQKRLGDLLLSFRQQHERNLLVRSVIRHFERQANFKPSDYAQRSQVPDCVNIARPLPIKTAISLERHSDEALISQIVRSLPARKISKDLLAKAAPSEVQADTAAYVEKQRALQEDAEGFFISCLESKKNQSALAYLAELKLAWSAEIWLYQIIAQYQSLPERDKKTFHLFYEEKQQSHFNQLLIINDVVLQAF